MLLKCFQTRSMVHCKTLLLVLVKLCAYQAIHKSSKLFYVFFTGPITCCKSLGFNWFSDDALKSDKVILKLSAMLLADLLVSVVFQRTITILCQKQYVNLNVTYAKKDKTIYKDFCNSWKRHFLFLRYSCFSRNIPLT